jgi:hypothetical protein
MEWREWVLQAVGVEAQRRAQGIRAPICRSRTTASMWRRGLVRPGNEAAVRAWAGALGMSEDEAVAAWRA